MDGKSNSSFDPLGSLTIAETIKIAASLHKGYHTGSMDFVSDSPWYAPYVEYALKNGIPIGAYRNLNVAATRSDFAVIIAGSLPDEAIAPINRIADGAIPDVWESYSYGQAVYKLYRAGILTGSDKEGTFFPGRTLSRAEAATLIMRIVDADTRASLSIAAELTGEQIYELASPAVFFIEVFDSDEKTIKSGSGFFICESGLAVTNYHVVVGASSMKITTDDGEVYDVIGIYDYNWKKDSALIQIDGSGFHYLELADSAKLQTGATVYALGSPLGLQASFSRGIVSRALREIEGSEYIQLDAAISSGSSGGALLDTSGRAVGVTNATAVGAQNINLAVPINFYSELCRANHVPVESILIKTSYYKNYHPAPDFGAFFNTKVYYEDTLRRGTKYAYRTVDLPGDAVRVIDEYKHLLEQNLFGLYGHLTDDGIVFDMYYNMRYDVTVTIGVEEIKGRECVTVALT